MGTEWRGAPWELHFPWKEEPEHFSAWAAQDSPGPSLEPPGVPVHRTLRTTPLEQSFSRGNERSLEEEVAGLRGGATLGMRTLERRRDG